jgi:hypothetical protein
MNNKAIMIWNLLYLNIERSFAIPADPIKKKIKFTSCMLFPK